MTARQTATASAPGGGTSVFQAVDALSATPRSVTDWGALINTALTAGTRTFIFGPYNYPFTTMIDGRQLQGITFKGAGGFDWYDAGRTDGLARETGHSRLIWGGTGSGFAIDLSSASTGANGNAGPVLEDVMVLYSSASYTGSLVNYKNGGFANINRCLFGPSASSAAASTPTAKAALALDGVNTIDIENVTFAMPAARGRETGGAGYSNIVRFRDCTFNGVAFINPGLDWLVDHCDFEGPALTAGQSCITTDITYTGDQVSLTLRDCSYWDFSGGTNKVVYAPAGNAWAFEAHSCLDQSIGAMAKLYDFQSTGSVVLVGGTTGNIVDMGDGTTAGAHKSTVVVMGLRFTSSTTVNQLVNATKGHNGVFVMSGSLHDGNQLGIQDGVLTIGREILNVHETPTVAIHAGVTNVSAGFLKGNDCSGVIQIQNTGGSPSATGLIADITLANPPSSVQGINTHTQFPVILIAPVVVDDGGNNWASATGAASTACGAYAQTKTVGAGGSQASFQIGITTALPAGAIAAFAYRIAHL